MENEAVETRVASQKPSLTSRLAGLSHIYAHIVNWSLVALFALMPLFFLPITIDALEVNKQTLLVLLTFVATLAWLGHMVSKKELTLKSGWMNAFPAFLWFAVLISSILSHASFTSWVGESTQEYMSFLTMTSFAIMFYLLVNTANEARIQRRLFTTLILSSLIIAILIFLQALSIPVFGFLGASFFNTIGTNVSTAIYLVAITLLGNGLWLCEKKSIEGETTKKHSLVLKVCTVLLSLLTLIILIAIDFWVLWVALLAGLIILFTFAMMRATEFPDTNKFILPMGLAVISLFLLFLPSPLHLNMSTEVSPSYGSSWSIATKTLSDSSALFGSGPGTFSMDYTKFKSVDLNTGNFWNVTFDRSSSHFLTILASLGIIGLLALILLIIVIATRSLNRLINERDHSEWKMTFVLFAPWVSLVIASVLYSSNLSLQFLFFALSGLLAGQIMLKKKTFAFNKSPRVGLAFSFLFVIVAVGIVTGLFVTGQRYAAEMAFAQAVRLDKTGGDLDTIIQKISQAASYNSLNDVYDRNLAQALIARVQKEMATVGTPIPSDKAQYIQQLIAASINAAKQATNLSPDDVNNWEMLGMTYREVSPVVQGADAAAVAAYQMAVTLDPQNPTHLTNLGQSYVIFSENARTQTTSKDPATAAAAKQTVTDDLKKAEDALNGAIALKADYAPAHYYLAVAYEREGRLADAIVKMEAVKKYNPLDVGVSFQLGLLYLRNGNYDLAQAELERAIALSPNYSNARWFLAAIYEQKKMTDKAIEQVQKVIELNPDNELAKTKLARLKAGQLTNTIPQPIDNNLGAPAVSNSTP